MSITQASSSPSPSNSESPAQDPQDSTGSQEQLPPVCVKAVRRSAGNGKEEEFELKPQLLIAADGKHVFVRVHSVSVCACFCVCLLHPLLTRFAT